MKSKRQALILSIIAQEYIETQEELAEALRRHDVNVTQATVSRDIKELRLIKVLSDKGSYRYAVEKPDVPEDTEFDRYARLFADSVISIVDAGNIIVIKTIAASAPACGEVVDGLKLPQIVGTIAGDNTLLAICKNIEDVDETVAKLKALTEKTAR